ncbi:MAG: GNAT family N-acetyltransferase [Candidatus Moraniibacteriota bacterium]|nr:MAG: GNAT family N-acetyltransferase [Candidatus Moranbacteria bacterium]
MLKGKKVRLRPLEMADVDDIMEHINDVDVNYFISRETPITRTEEEQWVKEMCSGGKYPKDIIFGIYILDEKCKDDQRIIGTCGLHNIHWFSRFSILGISIFDKSVWSKGYGTESLNLLLEYSFRTLGLHRVKSCVYAYNERSLALHKKLGFVQEGVERSAIYKRGEYHDVVLFGLLADEYKRRNVKSAWRADAIL